MTLERNVIVCDRRRLGCYSSHRYRRLDLLNTVLLLQFERHDLQLRLAGVQLHGCVDVRVGPALLAGGVHQDQVPVEAHKLLIVEVIWGRFAEQIDHPLTELRLLVIGEREGLVDSLGLAAFVFLGDLPDELDFVDVLDLAGVFLLADSKIDDLGDYALLKAGGGGGKLFSCFGC